jgi:hypothetical protein
MIMFVTLLFLHVFVSFLFSYRSRVATRSSPLSKKVVAVVVKKQPAPAKKTQKMEEVSVMEDEEVEALPQTSSSKQPILSSDDAAKSSGTPVELTSDARAGCGSASSSGGGGDDDGEEEEDGDQPKKKKKKGAISRELKAIMRSEGPKGKILHAMYKKNRPGNVATVENFTGHKIPKGVVQQILDDFAKSGELKMKDNNGKNKIYWFNQDNFRSKGIDVSKVVVDIEEKKEELSSLEEEHEGLMKTLRKIEAEPEDDDLERQIIELTERCAHI